MYILLLRSFDSLKINFSSGIIYTFSTVAESIEMVNLEGG
jgi:hypothetical protein